MRTVREGDLIAIPLADRLIAVGIVLHVSKLFKNGIMMGYFRQPFESVDKILASDLKPEFVTTPNYTSAQIIRNGFWKVIGHDEDLLRKVRIPELRSAYDIYVGDIVVRPASPSDIEHCPTLTLGGKLFIENQLRDFFKVSSGWDP